MPCLHDQNVKLHNTVLAAHVWFYLHLSIYTRHRFLRLSFEEAAQDMIHRGVGPLMLRNTTLVPSYMVTKSKPASCKCSSTSNKTFRPQHYPSFQLSIF
eukprot:41455-Amphidinium_carterae.1